MDEDDVEGGTWVPWGDIPLAVRRTLAQAPDEVLATNPPQWRHRERGYRERELLVKESVAKEW